MKKAIRELKSRRRRGKAITKLTLFVSHRTLGRAEWLAELKHWTVADLFEHLVLEEHERWTSP
jgi:hypothetical protein